MKFKIKDILPVLKTGLENLSSFSDGAKDVRAINVYLMNEDTICCDFYAEHKKALDVKMEISQIMGYFYGFFAEDGFEGIDFRNYAVKAFDQNKKEIMYAISDKKTAGLISRGGSIDWLKSTLFQENTADYRLGQAKKIISEIENCLRRLVADKFQVQFGADWWNVAIDEKEGKKVKGVYKNQLGAECNDGAVLINYTFVPQLQQIIVAHFNVFSTYFDNQMEFENQFNELNKIRREEAHNREISEAHLEQLENLHEQLTAKILEEYIEMQSVFLTENWRIKIKKIFKENAYLPLHSEPFQGNDVKLNYNKKTENLNHLINYLGDTVMKLNSVSVPVQKRDLQRKMVKVLDEHKDLHATQLEYWVKMDKEGFEKSAIEIKQHESKVSDFIGEFLLSES